MGSQLVKAQSLETGKGKDFRWKEIEEATASRGIRWRHAPSGAQWRDATEAQAKAYKHTMKHLTKSRVRTYPELQTILARAADIVCQRPLGITQHSGGEPGFTVLTPNSLIKNQRTTHFNPPEEDLHTPTYDRYTRRQREQEDSLQDWWNIWYRHVFASLIPIRKWRVAQRNVKVGDIALLLFKGKLSTADYRLCRVHKVFPDEDEDNEEDSPLVRTCVVQVAPKGARSINYPSPKYKLIEMTVPVQRLCVFLPVEEQGANKSDLPAEGQAFQDQPEPQDSMPEAGIETEVEE